MCDPAESTREGLTARARVQRASDALLAAVFRPMAHAINNPLQAALGAAELAALDTLDPQERAASLSTAQSEILRTAALLNSVQAFARGVERGERARSRFSDTLDRCKGLTDALVNDAGIQLEIDVELQCVAMDIDCPPMHLDLAWVGVVEACVRLGRGASPMRVQLQRDSPTFRVDGSFAAGAGTLELLPALLELLGSNEQVDAEHRSALTWRCAPGRWSLRGRVVDAL